MTPEQRLKEYVEVTKELSGLSFWEAQRIADLRVLLAEREKQKVAENELRDVLQTTAPSWQAILTSARELRVLAEERGQEIERLTKLVTDQVQDVRNMRQIAEAREAEIERLEEEVTTLKECCKQDGDEIVRLRELTGVEEKLRRRAEWAEARLAEETKAQDEALALLHKQIDDAEARLAKVVEAAERCACGIGMFRCPALVAAQPKEESRE